MFTGLLNSVMDIQSRTITVDAYGGQSVALTTTGSNIPCRINTLSNEQQAILSRSGIMATHKFFCDGNTVVGLENNVVYGGATYRVVNILDTNAADAVTHHKTMTVRTPA